MTDTMASSCASDVRAIIKVNPRPSHRRCIVMLVLFRSFSTYATNCFVRTLTHQRVFCGLVSLVSVLASPLWISIAS